MGHVAMWMNAEQQRRLVGNDVLFVVFLEEGPPPSPPPYSLCASYCDPGAPPFDPEPLDSLGTVPQIFCVVQPYAGRYRFALFLLLSFPC